MNWVLAVPFSFENISEDAVVLVAVMLIVFGSRMVRILANHQQRMAEIIHGSQQNQQMLAGSEEVENLKSEVETLKSTVNSQTLLLDTIARQQRELMETLKGSESVEERLGNTPKLTP